MEPDRTSITGSPRSDPWTEWAKQFLDADQKDLSQIFSNRVSNQQTCDELVRWSWTADKAICTQLHERLKEASNSLQPSNNQERARLDLMKTAAEKVPEWQGESVNFFNPTDVTLYARVYQFHRYGFMNVKGHYDPLSDLVAIPPRSSKTIEYAHGGDLGQRHVYYTTDSRIHDAEHAKKEWLQDSGPCVDISTWTGSYGRSYYDKAELAPKPNLTNREEKVVISNRRHYPIFVRAYEEYESGTAQPTSEIMNILPQSDITLPIAYGGGTRRIYYTSDAGSPEVAKSHLRDDGTFHGLIRVFQNFSDTFEIDKKTKIGKVIVGENAILPAALEAMHVAERTLKSAENSKEIQRIRELHQEEQKKIDKTDGEPNVVVENAPTGDISLSEREKDFSRARDVTCQAAMRSLFPKGELSEKDTFPRVGLAGSGGGFRAQLAFSGFMAGLHEEGLFQTFSYLSGISGSTWAMGDLLENDGDPDSTRTLPNRAGKGLKRGIITARFEPEYKDTLSRLQAERREDRSQKPAELNSAINIAAAIAQEASKEPLYDWAIGLQNTALSGRGNNAGLRGLHEYNLDASMTPLPIFNFVETVQKLTPTQNESTVENNKYAEFKATYTHDKWEATPMDVTGIPAKEDRGTREAFRVPTRGLGRTFDENGQGHVDESTPAPISLLSTITTAGSALSAGLAEAASNSEIAKDVLLIADSFVKAKLGADYNLSPGTATHKAVENPTLNRPYTGIIEGLPVQRPVTGAAGNKAYLRDAGFDYNLPLISLMRPSRECGIAVICDVSGDLNEEPGEALYKAVEDARSMGRKLPEELTNRARFVEKVREAIKNNDCPVVFGNPKDPDEFCIIYVPCVMMKQQKDSNMLAIGNWGKYDPTENKTLKLQYEMPESNMLHDFGRRLAKKVSPVIKQVEMDRIRAMNEQNK